MSPLVSNDLIFSCLLLFIVVSIASNTLNYMSVQTNSEALEQSGDIINYIKNITENSQKISQQNNELLELLEDRLVG